jgi:hypothetical protein
VCQAPVHHSKPPSPDDGRGHTESSCALNGSIPRHCPAPERKCGNSPSSQPQPGSADRSRSSEGSSRTGHKDSGSTALLGILQWGDHFGPSQTLPSSSKAAARPICADLVMIFSVPISRTTRRTFDSTACSQIRNLERIQPAYHNWICRSEAALLFKLSTNRPTFAENLSRIACASRPACRETVFTPRAN